jgi:hypothetical protein
VHVIPRIGLLVAMLTAAGCSTAPDAVEPAPVEAGWEPLPQSPLSPRTGAHAFWTGSMVLVVGGTDDVRCPPDADCVDRAPPLADGAAYDPESRTWTPLPQAPLPLGYVTGGVVVGTLYLWVPALVPGEPSAFISYTPGEETWTEHEAPFEPHSPVALVPAGGALVAHQTSHEQGVRPDLSYDPQTDRWTELPPDPLTPAFDRQLVWTGDSVVLLAHELVPQPNSAQPSRTLAARLDLEAGRWERLPDSHVLGGVWAWSGDRIVNAAIGGADGGEVNNWGRRFPFGGMLDPATSTWSDLAGTPEVQGELTGIQASGEGWVISGDGWAFHPRSETWVELDRPAAGMAEAGQAAVWTGNGLFVFGGSRVMNERFLLTDDAWSWTPPAGG